MSEAKIRLAGAFLALTISLAVFQSSATTVVTVMMTCPACGRELAGHEFGSWLQVGEPFRDMENSMFAANHRPVTCPRCLFSGVTELGTLDKDEVVAVRKALAELRTQMRPLPKTTLDKALTNPHGNEWDMLQIRVAEVCDRARKPDALRTARLRYAAYLHSKGFAETPLLAEERKRAIQNFEQALDGKVLGDHELLYRYLAGELNRRAGNAPAALAHFEKVRGSAGSRVWEYISLTSWAAEQSAKARAGETNDEVFPVADNEGKRRQEVSKRLPEMVAALRAGKPSKEWLLPGEDRFSTVWTVLDLLEEGDRRAGSFLIAWLARLEESEMTDRDYKLQRIALTFGRQPSIVDRDLASTVRFRTLLLSNIVQYAIGVGKFPAECRRSLESTMKFDTLTSVAVHAAAGRKDESVKPLLVSRMKTNTDILQVDALCAYFHSAGTTNDLPALEAYAARFTAQDWRGPGLPRDKRPQIEDVERALRVREVFRNPAR